MPSDPQVLGEQFFSYLRDLCVLGRRSPCSIDYFLCMPGEVCFVVNFSFRFYRGAGGGTLPSASSFAKISCIFFK